MTKPARGSRTTSQRIDPTIEEAEGPVLSAREQLLAKIEGTNAGCLEALMLNHKGEVAECTGDNIFLVRRGELHTPSIDAGILEGITRDAVIEIKALLVAAGDRDATAQEAAERGAQLRRLRDLAGLGE